MLLSASVLSAQHVGDRVRVSTFDPLRSPIEGNLITVEGDVRLETDLGALAPSVADVKRLEVYRGQRRQLVKGLWIGALSGGVLGIAPG